MKIERLLQSQGFGTRRECRTLVRAGVVEIGQRVVDDPFEEVVAEGLEFIVDGEIWAYRERAYLMLHKPLGYECSRISQHHRSVFELLPPQLMQRGVQPVGRLDVETTGLLLLSDEGQFIHAWSSGKKGIPKRYEVQAKHAVSADMLTALREGVQLRDEPMPLAARSCELRSERELSLVVTEGRYHQVRRMVAAAGNRAEGLHRAAIGGLELPEDLPLGEWRWLSEEDIERLARFD